ncbi:NACHT domain-containing protein [Nocardia sp. BMG111209]|uniref:NACHT domain-containing protein n=1 Tax=Nocardia sp. BMG111209 TaxID=1160137 RepID=UPI0012DDDCF5|nr:NACHT domain-containing protein [Nocardia sp. BMG111209]
MEELQVALSKQLNNVRNNGLAALDDPTRKDLDTTLLEQAAATVPGYEPTMTRASAVTHLLEYEIPRIRVPGHGKWLLILFGLRDDVADLPTKQLRIVAARTAGYEPDAFKRPGGPEDKALLSLAAVILADCFSSPESVHEEQPAAEIPATLATAWCAPTINDPELMRAVSDLAAQVSDQWSKEERIRQISDPFPIPIRWTNGPSVLTDHWQIIRGDLNRDDAIDLTNSLPNVRAMFESIPSGRLVILGSGGMGKTSLLLRLVIDFIAHHDPLNAVPVIFSIASWNPTQNSLRDWLRSRLEFDYPALRKMNRDGQSLAAQLLRHRLLIPVLDGFDEMTPALRPDAIRALNSSLSPGDPLILTSRPYEYGGAVEQSDVITGAATIFLSHLELDDLAAYLPLTARPDYRREDSGTKWSSVLRQLKNDSDSDQATRLLAVLSTPLMVSLARRIYSDTSADPIELMDSNMYSTQATLERHLLSRFVDVAYDDLPVEQLDHSRYRSTKWDANRARSWLESLAFRMYMYQEGPLFAWWQHAALSAVPFIIGFISLLITLDHARHGMHPWYAALIVGAGSGLLMINPWRSFRDEGEPSSYSKSRGGRHIARVVGAWRTELNASWPNIVANFIPLLGMSLVLVSVIINLHTPWYVWFTIPTVFVAFFAMQIVEELVSGRVDTVRAISPSAILVAARRKAVIDAALTGLIAAAAAYGVLLSFIDGRAPSFIVWYEACGLFAAGWGVGYVISSHWGRWIYRRMLWALTGSAPWRFMRFLDDAHRRGILRQTGSVYEFRHVLLCQFLAVSGQGRARILPPGRYIDLQARIDLAVDRFRWGEYELALEELDVLASSRGFLNRRGKAKLRTLIEELGSSIESPSIALES